MIYVAELIKKYQGEGYPFTVPVIAALERLRFTAPVTILCGDNGSGKSTLLSILAEKLDAARAWLSFLSENGGELAQSYSGISCISTAPRNEDDYGASAGYDVLDKYTDVEFVNMWDREYMPSGMWGSFGEAAGMFYADNSEENLVAIKDFLHDNYHEKYAAAHG